MIRINLLPVKQARKREFGKQQLAVGVALILIELLVLGYIYSDRTAALEDLKAEQRNVQADVAQLTESNSVLAHLSTQRDQLQELERILRDLETQRSGPVQVMDEVMAMLNNPINALERVEHERRGWDTDWDPRALWLRSFNETGGAVEISGTALSNNDIAEFNNRLSRSLYFSNVNLNFTSASSDPRFGRVYEFSISARVRYGLDGEQG